VLPARRELCRAFFDSHGDLVICSSLSDGVSMASTKFPWARGQGILARLAGRSFEKAGTFGGGPENECPEACRDDVLSGRHQVETHPVARLLPQRPAEAELVTFRRKIRTGCNNARTSAWYGATPRYLVIVCAL
jgi:hypothetical protein